MNYKILKTNVEYNKELEGIIFDTELIVINNKFIFKVFDILNKEYE